MNALTKEFLESIGITLDDTTYQAFAEHFDETLNQRIIESIVDSLDDEQLARFATLRDSGDDELWQWLQTNVPELGDIIQDEIDILLGDLAESADDI